MKVILKQDHDLLGDQGQIVEVKNGYARNFLIPNGIATMANKSNLKSHEEITRQRRRKTDKIAADSNRLAETLSAHSFEFKVKTGDENKLFGSVTSQMIHDLLAEKGFITIEKKKIQLKEPIRELGEHDVEIKLPQSVIASIKVHILKENAEPEIKASEESPKEDVTEIKHEKSSEKIETEELNDMETETTAEMNDSKTESE